MNLRGVDKVSSMARLVKTSVGNDGAPVASSEAVELERRAREAAETTKEEDADGGSEDSDDTESEAGP
jgi:hypothetical protein